MTEKTRDELAAENAALRDVVAAIRDALDVPVPADTGADADAAHYRTLFSRALAAGTTAAVAAVASPVTLTEQATWLRQRVEATPTTYPAR